MISPKMSIAGLFCSFNIFSNKVTFSLSVPTNRIYIRQFLKKLSNGLLDKIKNFLNVPKHFSYCYALEFTAGFLVQGTFCQK